MGTKKSFYGKAIVIEEDGLKKLYSYNTLIMIKKDDRYYKVWDRWTSTTGKHIKAFSGLNKKEYMVLEVLKDE